MADTKISALDTKTTPIAADLTNILDSAASNADKKMRLDTIPLAGNAELKALTTGLLKNTTTTGALSIAAATDLPSAIDATKIADGSVTNTEFQYIGTLTSNAQTQLNSKADALTGTPADDSYEGVVVSRTAGENLVWGDNLWQGPEGRYWKFTASLPAIWTANTETSVGTVIRATTFNPLDNSNNIFLLFCSAIAGDARTHVDTEPTWSFTLGGTIVDDQVTWTYIGFNSYRASGMAVESITAGNAGDILFGGFARDDGSWTYIQGQPLYSHTSTAGAVTQERTSTQYKLIQIIGRCDGSTHTRYLEFNHPIIVVP